MDRVAALQAFIRVVEAGGFTRASEQLGLSRARVSRQIQQLEDHLGVRLLHRTTRRVRLTEDGRALLDRGREWLDDLDEIETLFEHRHNALSGLLRVDVGHAMARHLLIPELPGLLAAHPGLELELSVSDGLADPVREGLDLVVRGGRVRDAQLIARPLGDMAIVNCASPGYLARHGTPRSPADLENGHRVVHYVPRLGEPLPRWEYVSDGQTHHLPLPGVITVNSTGAYTDACRAGLGLIQVPRVGVQWLLDAGELIEVMPGHRAEPMPISFVYPHRRNLSRRVRGFMDWLGPKIQAYYRLA
ncbi:LysR family transcriptional regulator [Salinisphaera sp. RV14]|uniref:LysR family transcriptional regulator n=1 Tax=Salinisphaera sp. RV14 TaxID=3454140 RepID=UPI003F831CC2